MAVLGALPGERAQQKEALGILSVWVRASDNGGFRKWIKGKRRGMIRPVESRISGIVTFE